MVNDEVVYCHVCEGEVEDGYPHDISVCGIEAKLADLDGRVLELEGHLTDLVKSMRSTLSMSLMYMRGPGTEEDDGS